ncbi:MAG: hypothetical protein ACOY5B_05005 [Spirochaetota bacterium]
MPQNISKEESVLLDAEGDLELWLLGLETRDEFNQFVLKVYNDAFTDGSYKIPARDIAEPTAEYFHRARVCGVRHKSGKLIGTWGLILKDASDTAFRLPIEVRYDLPVERIVHNLKSAKTRFAFNGWRTAVDKDALEKFAIDRNKSIFVFDFLIRGLTMDLPGDPAEYLGLAEMEKLVYKYHRRVGIPWQIIGEPVHFWNRDRYPCAFQLGEFRDYMRAHHPERYEFLYERVSQRSGAKGAA